ncbi:hypothetical protein DGWBC_1358 [Dehalogenimonas sp. WBC-2]|nr:hypothetical protein DGWBC_1358 [Dehalogenimonas sp. WBC-2]
MWSLYAKNNQGIAIQSTFSKIVDSMKKVKEHIFIGKVQYIDWDKDWLPEGNLLYPFIHKRKNFEHEQELRAVIQDMSAKGESINLSAPPWENGIYIPVALNILIEKVYLSPITPTWVFDLLKSTTAKYGYSWEISRSSLDDTPVY